MKNFLCLTTIPTRLEYLPIFLSAIKKQTVQPDKIILFVPKKYNKRKFEDIDIKKIPKEFCIERCIDYGPATKILPGIEKFKGQDIRLIFCDDDRIYSSNWLERLIDFSNKHPNSCIADEVTSVDALLHLWRYGFTKKGFSYRIKRFFSLGIWKPKNFNNVKPNIIHGFGGVVVKPFFFKNDTFDIPELAWPNDDIWLSAHLKKNGIEIIYTYRSKNEKSLQIAKKGDSIYIDDELVNSIIDGKNKLEVNYQIFKYCIEKLKVWENYKKYL